MNKYGRMKNNKGLSCEGFLVIEILIAGLILTAGVAASMYLFRVGYQSLVKARQSNLISSKIPLAVSMLKTAKMTPGEKKEDLGEDVTMVWRSLRLATTTSTGMGGAQDAFYAIFLYRVDFTLVYEQTAREYSINVFQYDRKYRDIEKYLDTF